ncbi:bifunctional 2',3'-cyclic-nucleotide 2'-phosphodiesterase/3'-nucleotidase [Chromobacterium sp. IIBBL 290-4]|uniref:bifunctional 2',3'-cyclic-nucleotide 2'-phosphodiesterase/3'-nucleotidase n=1 Tax=Chromobacterium sp. IIBBL 290-4 TaxID=2953890 RepID=UPI0020B70047|nr:bifunctional 2',3'-cyclic-nucleotide 2'-phosphodiesterase/3'-nucleotidase [Chromobacterium sp. IIBBL 290-4]UTH72996.1 bifunctional 2',3'-cyclic-nucleotide 2'-phosphodiesterase/3'-nucleotidase [Chromobacterium sp. IIBBL 290-4]
MKKCLALAGLAGVVLSGCSSVSNNNQPAEGTTVNVALLETTDIHQNVLSYDYYKLAANPSFGLERAATLIQQARAQYPNNLLLDDGDLIQGTALGDYQAVVNPVKCGDTLAVHKVMNYLKYDAGTIGNHEFNYGLPFLSQVTNTNFRLSNIQAPNGCGAPAYPLVLANVANLSDKQPIFKPYAILSRTFAGTAPDGSSVQVPVKVGVIGFTPPTIMDWDKKNLQGQVYTNGVVETANTYIPKMRQEGADLVVALSHGGLDPSAYSPTMENGSWHLTKTGIDALLIGHSHDIFPNPGAASSQFNNMQGVDNSKGFVNGVPTVMGGNWGNRLGVIKLTLKFTGGKWVVQNDKSAVETRSIRNADGSYVAADPNVSQLAAAEHQGTINYVKTPIGTTDFEMNTYFALLGDVSAIQIVNMAQKAYVENYVKTNLPQYANIPVLSVSAPFKAGRNGASDYTDVAPGAVAINNAADLYLYPNTVQAVLVKGSDIKNWLERAAQMFNTIAPGAAGQELINSNFQVFNFDVMYGVKYQIDVSQPVGSRIVNLTYNGSAIDPNQQFIVATNNYRASGGGNFPGIDGTKTIVQAPDANRDVLIQYIKDRGGKLDQATYGASRSWSFVKISTPGGVVFKSIDGKQAIAQAAGVSLIGSPKPNGDGTATYMVDLGQ